MLQNEYVLANIGADTAENWPTRPNKDTISAKKKLAKSRSTTPMLPVDVVFVQEVGPGAGQAGADRFPRLSFVCLGR